MPFKHWIGPGLSGPVEPHASKLSGPGAGAPSELTILRTVYFRTPNFLGQSPLPLAAYPDTPQPLRLALFVCRYTLLKQTKLVITPFCLLNVFIENSLCIRALNGKTILKLAKIHSLHKVAIYIKFTLYVSVLSESFPLKSSTNALKALSRTNPKPFSCNQKPRALGAGRAAARRRHACGSD